MDDSPIVQTLRLELERKIFELAALSRPKAIPTLMRVAWRVKLWVEPLLYWPLKYLRALVLLHTPPAHLSAELAIFSEDPRFVMMQLEYYEEDWQAGILTGDDYWVRADDFIAKRIAREIERESSIRMFPYTCS
ncbi:hypothetical protein C8R44DRAFT_871785 [Mycena epipterygia]|nr:hypothetical protein C8R44DRAFT_871785 [Mycena epipterygia]